MAERGLQRSRPTRDPPGCDRLFLPTDVPVACATRAASSTVRASAATPNQPLRPGIGLQKPARVGNSDQIYFEARVCLLQ